MKIIKVVAAVLFCERCTSVAKGVNMEPRYSILYFKEELTRHHDRIRSYLLDGIKVFWFGNTHDCDVLRKEFSGFNVPVVLSLAAISLIAAALNYTFILVAVFFIGQQIYDGITVRDNILNMAHIVGGITGGVLGYKLNKKSRVERWHM